MTSNCRHPINNIGEIPRLNGTFRRVLDKDIIDNVVQTLQNYGTYFSDLTNRVKFLFGKQPGITGTNGNIYPANEMAAIQKILFKSRSFVQRLYVLFQ